MLDAMSTVLAYYKGVIRAEDVKERQALSYKL
jgi:hypothetical protein